MFVFGIILNIVKFVFFVPVQKFSLIICSKVLKVINFQMAKIPGQILILKKVILVFFSPFGLKVLF